MIKMRQYSKTTTFSTTSATKRVEEINKLRKSQVHAQVGLVDAADALAIAKRSE